MSPVAQSTIAQAIYANPQDCSFVRVVTELEGLLSRLRNNALRTRWDYEDIVVFDIGETRIVLGWSEDQTDDVPACLLISVGPLPTAADVPNDPAYETLCSRLVERIQTRYPPDAVLWRQLPLAIEPELVDALIDALPPIGDVLDTQGKAKSPAPPPDSAETSAQAEKPDTAPKETGTQPRLVRPALQKTNSANTAKTGPAHTPAGLQAANDSPDLPKRPERELDRVRAALYPPDPAKAVAHDDVETPQMRLAAQAMNATLIMVWMPLGVAAMTYSLIKGEKMAFSARMMALTGALAAWSQTPLGQQVAALAGA